MRNVEIVTEAKMKDITPEHVVYTDSKGNDVTIPADSVVLAMDRGRRIPWLENLSKLA